MYIWKYVSKILKDNNQNNDMSLNKFDNDQKSESSQNQFEESDAQNSEETSETEEESSSEQNSNNEESQSSETQSESSEGQTSEETSETEEESSSEQNSNDEESQSSETQSESSEGQTSEETSETEEKSSSEQNSNDEESQSNETQSESSEGQTSEETSETEEKSSSEQNSNNEESQSSETQSESSEEETSEIKEESSLNQNNNNQLGQSNETQSESSDVQNSEETSETEEKSSSEQNSNKEESQSNETQSETSKGQNSDETSEKGEELTTSTEIDDNDTEQVDENGSPNLEEENNKFSEEANRFLNELNKLPSFEDRQKGDGYSIDNKSKSEIPDSIVRTLITKFLNQRFCKNKSDLNNRSNSLEKSDGFYKWEVKDVIIHSKTHQLNKVLNDKYSYEYAEGRGDNVPLSFYFDLSGSMSNYSNMLATIAIELLKKNVKVLIGFNERVNVQIDSIQKNITVEELEKILTSAGSYGWNKNYSIKDSRVKFKHINEYLDRYLIDRKAEKCVVFSDFDAIDEIIQLSKSTQTYWFCFEQYFTRKDLNEYSGFLYPVQNADDIIDGLVKVNERRFETLCYVDNPKTLQKRR